MILRLSCYFLCFAFFLPACNMDAAPEARRYGEARSIHDAGDEDIHRDDIHENDVQREDIHGEDIQRDDVSVECTEETVLADCRGGVNQNPFCTNGQCEYRCASDFMDCDSAVEGCETPFKTSLEHCGRCGNSCSVNSNRLQPICKRVDATNVYECDVDSSACAAEFRKEICPNDKFICVADDEDIRSKECAE